MLLKVSTQYVARDFIPVLLTHATVGLASKLGVRVTVVKGYKFTHVRLKCNVLFGPPPLHLV